jgi:putative ABC transport system ATP-binding protein
VKFAVEVKDLFHIYPSKAGGVAALRGLNFAVLPGEVCVVRGPNGSGKSTLTEIIAGTIQPSAGTVNRHGELRRLRQHGNIIEELSVLEYLEIATHQAKRVLIEWNLEEVSSSKLSELGTGQQQIVAAAAALASNPQVLLADEPAGALSSQDSLALYRSITNYCREHEVALILVTHDVNAEQYADRIVRISDGRLSEEWLPSGAEKTLIDHHGWLRIPKNFHVQLPATASIERINEKLLLSELVFDKQESSIFQTSPNKGEVVKDFICENTSGKIINFKSHRGEISLITGAAESVRLRFLRELVAQALEEQETYSAKTKIRMFAEAVGHELSVREAGVNEHWVDFLKLGSFANQPMGTLSGGQMQKAQLGIALSQHADLLVLVEPTSALDEENRHLVCSALLSMPETGILISTHDELISELASQHVSID